MNRRTILKYTAIATGAGISGALSTIILSGCKLEPPIPDYKPQFFLPTEYGLLKSLVDLILPKTESPAASEVGVHQMMDKMIGNVYEEKDRNSFKRDFTAFAEYLNANGFFGIDSEKQLDFLKEIEATEEPKKEEEDEEPKLDENGDEIPKPPRSPKKLLLDIKQQTIAYYLQSEEISTQFLNYLPVPGEYEPCISLKESGGVRYAIN